MNENETELKVQALVDGELTGREAEELRARLESDAGLRTLHARLTELMSKKLRLPTGGGRSGEHVLLSFKEALTVPQRGS